LTHSVTFTLSQYAASTSFTTLPAVVTERAKQVIFDEIACAHFGQRSAAGAMAARYAAAFGGSREAQVFGTNLRLSAPYAALANGTAGHGEEVDGAHVVGGHPGASIVHAAAAMAERQRAPGAELINAVVLGYDIGVRVVQACGGKFVVRDRHHLTSDLFYALGATAAASRILGLGAERICHALALATFQTNGLYALYSERRHISKSFCNGQYAFAGVSAALMSATGLEGNEDILGSPHGLLDAWGDQGRRELITHGLGEDYAIAGANFKFFNAGYPIHTPVEATMTLVSRHNLRLESIKSIEVGMPSHAMRVVNNRHMHNICVQDMLAASLIRDGLKIGDLPFPSVLSDPAFSRVRAQIELVVDPDLEREHPNGRGAKVTITTVDGSTFSLRIDHPRGHNLRGDISWSDLAEKWHDNLPGCDVDAALTLAQRLNDVEDVTELSSMFKG
jgi:2-methylcitrate dehydratase PrpD